MKRAIICPFCGSSGLDEVSYDESIKLGRRRLHVEGLLKHVCTQCSMEIIDPAQQEHNSAITDSVIAAEGVMTPGMLRTFREKWGLSQREASLIFKAGDSAFAKWESGQSNMSGPASLLVECADIFDGMLDFLAAKVNVNVRTTSGGRWPWAHGSIDACNESLYVNAAERVEIYTPSKYSETSASQVQGWLSSIDFGTRSWEAETLRQYS